MIFLKWFAALFLDKLIALASASIKLLISKLKRDKKIKEEKAKDTTNADTYQSTLKDGVSESSQIDESLSVLNGRDPDHKS